MKPTPAAQVRIHIDGGARGNPGPAAAGVVIVADKDGRQLFAGGFFLGRATNNVAEYHGLLEGLLQAQALGAGQVEVVSDSELLVRQMNGQYRVKNAGLKPLFQRAQSLRDRFAACTFRHVGREQNAQADGLVNQALDLRRNVGDAATGKP